jgi:hypothetical protein
LGVGVKTGLLLATGVGIGVSVVTWAVVWASLAVAWYIMPVAKVAIAKTGISSFFMAALYTSANMVELA